MGFSLRDFQKQAFRQQFRVVGGDSHVQPGQEGAEEKGQVFQPADKGGKIGAVGILVSVLTQVLKHSGREEQAFLASLAGLVIVLMWILPYISELFATIETLFAF